MPNIRELFIDPALTDPGGEDEFDLDKLLGEVDSVLADRPKTNLAPEPEPVSDKGEPSAPDPEDEEGEPQEPGEEVEVEPEGQVAAPVPPAPSPPPDPLADIPPERRAALLALHETLERDPAKAEAVLRGLTAETAAPAPPTATLPQDIDPESFEASLWRQQQETSAQISQLAGLAKTQNDAFVKQQANVAAQQAGATFAARYEGKLDQADIVAIAKAAGESGIAGVLAGTEEGKRDLAGAYDRALETTLWSNESFRAKVVGEAPVVAVADRPETKARKRKLTALSSAASPVSGPPEKRSPLETREDGRLTPQSRMGLVREMANGLARGSASDGTL